MDNGASSYNRFLKGDNSGFEELVILYNKRLIRFIDVFVNNLTVSEDLVADTFLELLIKKYHFRENYKFQTWLFKIARNNAIDYLRKHAKIINIPIDDLGNILTNKITPEELSIESERNKQLYEAMSVINADYSQVLYLIYFEEMSYEQIAKVLKKSYKQIDNLAYRAKKALKSTLERNDFIYENWWKADRIYLFNAQYL